MKKLLSFSFLLIFIFGTAQDFSYGVVVGNSFYSIANNNGTNSFQTESTYTSFAYGGYGEFNFTQNMGVKMDVLFSRNMFIYHPNKQEFTMKLVAVSPNFKYDFGEVYYKGFYMLAGPKFSFATSVESDGEEVNDDFNTFLFGAQLGFGWRILNYIDFQTKLEMDLTPFYKFENGNKSNFFGAIISVNVDLAKILSSK
jgi:hypothetical protein